MFSAALFSSVLSCVCENAFCQSIVIHYLRLDACITTNRVAIRHKNSILSQPASLLWLSACFILKPKAVTDNASTPNVNNQFSRIRPPLLPLIALFCFAPFKASMKGKLHSRFGQQGKSFIFYFYYYIYFFYSLHELEVLSTISCFQNGWQLRCVVWGLWWASAAF